MVMNVNFQNYKKVVSFPIPSNDTEKRGIKD